MAVTGKLAATQYGAAVNGISDSELCHLQRIASVGSSPSARGRSLAALLAMTGDPTAGAATAPILYWAKVAWRSGSRLPGETTTADLAAAWKETDRYRCRFISSNGRRRWDQSLGPIGACMLSLDRLGWYSPDGLTLVDDLGIERRIEEVSPEMWKLLLCDAVQTRP